MKKATLLLASIFIATIAEAQLPAMVQDIAPGRYDGQPGGMLTWRGKMYFVASDTSHGYELWSYDETSPARMEFDFNPGRGNGMGGIVVYNDKLFFSGDNGSGYEVYSYDGVSSPVKLTSLWPKANTGAPQGFTVAGNTLYFAASHYRPNVPNPLLVTDLFSYDGTDTPRFYTSTSSSNFGLMPAGLIAHNNKLYFAGAVTTPGPIKKIHEVDPATGIIRILDNVVGNTDKFYGFSGPLVLDGKLYFSGFQYRHLTVKNVDSTTVGQQLHCLEGDSIRQLTHLGPGMLYPGVKAGNGSYKGAVYFGGTDSDSTIQLYSYDPATNAVGRSCIISPTKFVGGLVGEMAEYNSRLYFVPYDPSLGYELWQYSDEDCGLVMDIFPGRGTGVSPDGPSFHIYKGHLYFCANDSVHGRELWRIEGATGIKNITWSGSVVAYPNPARTDANLDITLAESQNLQVVVRDASGKRLYGTPLQRLGPGKSKMIIPMESWSSGLYFYQLTDALGSRLASGRIVRQ